MTTIRSDIDGLRTIVTDCQLHVTNHLPTQISELSLNVDAVKDRLELHEEREERQWDLVNTVLNKMYEKPTG